MASSMKPVEVIQEVKILPRAKASHQPGSETRWREETNVRNRVEQDSRVCIEPRKVFESRGPARDHHLRMPAPWVWELRTVSGRWNAVSALSLSARQGRGHRGRRPDHAGQRDNTGTRERLISLLSRKSRISAEPKAPRGAHRVTKAPPGKARRPAGSIHRTKRGDDRYGGTSGNAKELRMGVRQS
jgi:hypothetical protein